MGMPCAHSLSVSCSPNFSSLLKRHHGLMESTLCLAESLAALRLCVRWNPKARNQVFCCGCWLGICADGPLGKTRRRVKITDCGELELAKPAAAQSIAS